VTINNFRTTNTGPNSLNYA
jgi:hypothetical protein